jgi:hypothetical protein
MKQLISIAFNKDEKEILSKFCIKQKRAYSYDDLCKLSRKISKKESEYFLNHIKLGLEFSKEFNEKIEFFKDNLFEVIFSSNYFNGGK